MNFENPFKKIQQSHEEVEKAEEEDAVTETAQAAETSAEAPQFRTADSHGVIHSADSQEEAARKAAEANRTY